MSLKLEPFKTSCFLSSSILRGRASDALSNDVEILLFYFKKVISLVLKSGPAVGNVETLLIIHQGTYSEMLYSLTTTVFQGHRDD